MESTEPKEIALPDTLRQKYAKLDKKRGRKWAVSLWMGSVNRGICPFCAGPMVKYEAYDHIIESRKMDARRCDNCQLEIRSWD